MNDNFRIDIFQTKNEIMRVLGLTNEVSEYSEEHSNDIEFNMFEPLLKGRYLNKKILRKMHSDCNIMIWNKEL